MDRDADERWMRKALDACRQGIEGGGAPFGAVVVRGEELIASAYNTVNDEHDASAHAEVNALRIAGAKLGTARFGEDCVLYTSCEPCPMCFAMSVFSRIGRIVWSASVEDAEAAGFTTLQVSNDTMIGATGHVVPVTKGVLREDGVALFKLWQRRSETSS
ncbi:MAG: nucleoside deaminase [Planctomycetota bacterium]